MRVSAIAAATLACSFASPLSASQTPPSTYPAISSRQAYPEPALPALPTAGGRFTDPTFGTRLLRVTDAATRPGQPGRSFTTTSAAHQLAWNATSDRFYVRSIDGTIIPYTFDAPLMRASRITPGGTGDGGLTIASQVEPQFSFVSRDTLFVSGQDPTNDWPVIRRFDFATLAYTDIINLGALTTVASHTYAGALSSSAGSPERICVIFGGQQDTHYKVAVFGTEAGANPVVLNAAESWIERGGVRATTGIPLGFSLHHAWIDKSGRYILLYPVGADPVPYVVWDLTTDVLTRVNAVADGHDALGFGTQVNQACCTTTTYDAAQWQYRQLSAPAATIDLISPVLTPQEVFFADHPSWNNASSSALVPMLSATYRYGLNAVPWRAWDDEVIAVQTSAPGSGAAVWRFGHHRSNVEYDGVPGATYFWYLPRAVVSPDGRWALFTSNWEKTLGPATGAEAGGSYRTDVFMAALTRTSLNAFTDDPLASGGTVIRAVHILELRTRVNALRLRFGLPAVGWTDGNLSGVPVRAIHFTELRNALAAVFAAAGQSAPAFSHTIVAGTVVVRAVDIEELRDAVVRLELM